MEKKMTREEYKNHIEKLKQDNGINRLIGKVSTREEFEDALGEFFEKGTEITSIDGKVYIAK